MNENSSVRKDLPAGSFRRYIPAAAVMCVILERL